MLGDLVNARPPSMTGQVGFEKTIYSFDKAGAQGVPEEFNYWSKRLGQEAVEGTIDTGGAWEIKVEDDDGLERWFDQLTDQPEFRLEGMEMNDDSGSILWKEMWNGLGRPVLKSDLLR